MPLRPHTRLMLASIALVLGGCRSAEEEPCPYPAGPQVEFPGIQLDDLYSQIRQQIPADSDCHTTANRPCHFVDELGYTTRLSDAAEWWADGKVDRWVFRREAARGLKPAWLPYGVKWSDTPEAVRRKLGRAGIEVFPAKPDDASVYVRGCYGVEMMRLEFIFSGNELQEVVQALPFP
jgi:hypothetical protein